MRESVWNKPAICIFREREPFEVDPFVVVKAQRIVVSRFEDGTLSGEIKNFFTLMGDADYISSPEGSNDHYVMCWFDNAEPDMNKDLRRLRGVTFFPRVSYVVSESGKRTYNASFKAKHGKLE